MTTRELINQLLNVKNIDDRVVIQVNNSNGKVSHHDFAIQFDNPSYSGPMFDVGLPLHEESKMTDGDYVVRYSVKIRRSNGRRYIWFINHDLHRNDRATFGRLREYIKLHRKHGCPLPRK